MKSSLALLFVSFCVVYFSATPAESQLAFLNCPAKIASALLGECQKRLQERLDLVNTAEQEVVKIHFQINMNKSNLFLFFLYLTDRRKCSIDVQMLLLPGIYSLCM